MKELSLEQWTQSLEALSEINEAVSDIGLVAEPTEGLSAATIDVIQTAIDHVGKVNGLENRAVVISAESYSTEGLKEFVSTAITKVKEFIKAFVKQVLAFLAGFDQGVRNVLMTVKRWDDKAWEHIDDFMGNDRSSLDSTPGALDFVIGIGVGDKQIDSLDGLLKAYQDFHKSLDFQRKVLDRDSALINDLLAAVGHFGKAALDSGVKAVEKAVKDHASAIQDTEFKANKDILGGIELIEVGRPDNLGVTDNPVFDQIKSITTVRVQTHKFEAKTLKGLDGKILRKLASEVESVNKSLFKYKDNFTKYARDIEAETEKLDRALKSMAVDEKDPLVSSSLMLGQRVTATVMWLSSNYFSTGVKLMSNAGEIDKSFMRYLDKVSKAVSVVSPDKLKNKPKDAKTPYPQSA